jgi:hypothetical protein
MERVLGAQTMIEVFPIDGILKDFDARLNQAALMILVLLFLVSLGLYALNRFENFVIDSKIYSLIVFAVLIGLWPHILQGIKSLVDALNTFLITSVFANEFGIWRGRETLGGLVWSRISLNVGIFDSVLKILSVLLTFLLDVAQYFLYAFFLVFFFFFKIFGPFVLARGVLSEDFSVFRQMLREVSLLFLWQTTFIILVGVFLMTFGERA